MPEPRGPEGAKCKCGHSMDQHTDSMAAAPCAFWGCRCDDFDQDPAPSPPGPEGQQADRCDVCGVSVAECRGHRWVDPAPSSPSPAGPGEAELNRLIAGCELAGRDERHSTGKLYLDAAASLRALLARLRESRDAHEQSVLAALVQAGALRAEVARLTDQLATARREEREAFTPKPTDQDKSGGWSISTAWIQSVQDGAKEDVSMEQVEAVLVSAAALRTREAAP